MRRGRGFEYRNANDARISADEHLARIRHLAIPPAWRDGSASRPLTARDINEDIRRRTKGDFSAKDFRTLRGTAVAARSLARTGPRSTVAGRRDAVAHAVREVANILGNTPATARSAYVDPRVIDLYEHGEVLSHRTGRAIESELLDPSSKSDRDDTVR